MSGLTELIAINTVLAASGIRSVTNVNSLHPAAIAAKNVLDLYYREIQADGRYYNTETRTLALSNTGEIILPSNTLDVDATDTSKKVAHRGTRLYDTKNNTFTFTAALEVDITVELAFDDLPFVVANYVMRRAVLEHYINRDGDKVKTQALAALAEAAQVQYERTMLRNADVSATHSPQSQKFLHRFHRRPRHSNPILPGG